jgi:pyruvate dehydrogenase E2 component (dihydrolipoamide acetyltransferase)
MAIEVLVPPLGQTVDTVTLVTWYHDEGDEVSKGSPLFAIETDKATLDVEAPASGILRQLTAQPGEEVRVLSAVAFISEPGETVVISALSPDLVESLPSDASSPAPASQREEDGDGKAGRLFISPRARRLAEQHNVPLTALPASGPEGAVVERDVRAFLEAEGAAPVVAAGSSITPVARRMAEEGGLDWRRLTGSGPGGRVTREDVRRALEVAPSAGETVPVAGEVNEVAETVPLRSVRAVIAERMARSVTDTARVTLTAQADATALVALRQRLAQDEVRVSYNDLFMYILGRALREHPQLNASLDEDTIKVWRRIHIGLAVDSDRGLLVPVVRDVDSKGLSQLAEETRAVVGRALTGKSSPDELTGGTFTLTNLGMYGIDAFTPIINLPECAILGVGRIARQPVAIGDRVVARHMVWLSLSFDHRLVDGGPAAYFLQRVVQLVEGPHLLMT